MVEVVPDSEQPGALSPGASPPVFCLDLEKKKHNRIVVGCGGGEPPPIFIFRVVYYLMFVIWIALIKNWEDFKDL